MVCFSPVRYGVQLTFRALALRQSCKYLVYKTRLNFSQIYFMSQLILRRYYQGNDTSPGGGGVLGSGFAG